MSVDFVHIYVLATQVTQHGDPLVCTLWTALVAHFYSNCHPSKRTGGAGVIVRKFAGDEFKVLEQTAYPLADCPDSHHAEGFAGAYAVQALAQHFPSHSDAQECVIIGDNSSILNYCRRTARARRSDLVTVLQQAQLLAATELPAIRPTRGQLSLRVSPPRVRSVLRRHLTLDGITMLHPPFPHSRPSAWLNAQQHQASLALRPRGIYRHWR